MTAKTTPKKRQNRRARFVNFDKIVWEEPKQSRQGRGKQGQMQRFVEVLKSRPNEWAVYSTKHPNCAVITYGKKNFPKTEWTSRKNTDGTFKIYARYIGK